jgi:CTP:molybdopterin cytidylyltransferase MocA
MDETQMTPAPVAGLLLAAGGGRRLGGRPKALLGHRGRPLVEHAARTLRDGGCAAVHVVLGASADEVRARADLPGCVLVDNPLWTQGMGSSLRAGIASLAGGGFAAALVLLVDQPGIGAAAVARVLAAGGRQDPAGGAPEGGGTAGAGRRGAGGPGRGALVCAVYGGRRGHPVVLGADRWADVAAAAAGDRGARTYLRAHEDEIDLVECGDVAEPYDIDTEEDLARLE